MTGLEEVELTESLAVGCLQVTVAPVAEAVNVELFSQTSAVSEAVQPVAPIRAVAV